MSQILTITIDVDGEQKISVNWFNSDGLTDRLSLAAVQAVERALQLRIARAEVEAERAAQADGEQAGAPVAEETAE